MAGTDVAKAKCKAVRNRAFSVMRMTRATEKILVFASRFSIKVSFYCMKPSLTESMTSRKGMLLNECEHVNCIVECIKKVVRSMRWLDTG